MGTGVGTARVVRWAAAGTIAALGFVDIDPDRAVAGPQPGPSFVEPPSRVYTLSGIDLAFRGDDPISQETRDIVFTMNGDDSTCTVENPADEGHSGQCAFAQIQILEANRGTLEIDDSAIAYQGAGRSGDIVFNIGGPIADVQSALASLTYVPPDDEFETTDGTPVTARIQLQDPQSPSHQTASLDIDIRVEGENDWPEIEPPGDAPYEVAAGQDFDVLESAGAEVFHVTDDDADQDEIDDFLLGVMWVDCGLISLPVLDSYATDVGDPLDLLDEVGLDPSLLPVAVANNVAFGSDTSEVVGVAWLAQLDADNETFTDNFNEAIRWITFHAPLAPSTCTLTMVVSDLGNNGMPLPGEIPNPGVDVAQIQFNIDGGTTTTTTTTIDEGGGSTTSSSSSTSSSTTSSSSSTSSTSAGSTTSTTSTILAMGSTTSTMSSTSSSLTPTTTVVCTTTTTSPSTTTTTTDPFVTTTSEVVNTLPSTSSTSSTSTSTTTTVPCVPPPTTTVVCVTTTAAPPTPPTTPATAPPTPPSTSPTTAVTSTAPTTTTTTTTTVPELTTTTSTTIAPTIPPTTTTTTTTIIGFTDFAGWGAAAARSVAQADACSTGTSGDPGGSGTAAPNGVVLPPTGLEPPAGFELPATGSGVSRVAGVAAAALLAGGAAIVSLSRRRPNRA